MPSSDLPVPGFPKLFIPKVTIASLAVYSVMGGIGYGLKHVKHTNGLGGGMIVAALIGAGYAVAHGIVANVSPETVNGVDIKGV